MTKLDAIEARLAAATPGPWTISHHNDNQIIRGDGTSVADTWYENYESNALFIAHAPDDMAALLAVAKVAMDYRYRDRLPLDLQLALMRLAAPEEE